VAATRQRSRIVGRLLRLATAALLLSMIVEETAGASFGAWRQIGYYFVFLVGIYSALHLFIDRFVSSLNKWLGAVLAVVPVILVAIYGGGVGTIAAISYISVSLLIVAARADGGCEVMAIPSLIFGRYTHLACLVFSPIDWIERKIYQLVGIDDEKDEGPAA
jgi:hypothetical protein